MFFISPIKYIVDTFVDNNLTHYPRRFKPNPSIKAIIYSHLGIIPRLLLPCG